MIYCRKKNASRRCSLLSGLLCLAACLSLNTAAHAQADCEALLKEADQKIYTGFFDDALDMVDRCLAQPGLPDSTKARAYRLKALAYDGKNYLGQAKDAIRELLRLAPDYMPDPIQDPPSYRGLVDQVREEAKKLQPPPVPRPREEVAPPRKKSNKKWFIIGGGVVGAAAIAALTLGGRDDDGNGTGITPPPPLPPPPDLP